MIRRIFSCLVGVAVLLSGVSVMAQDGYVVVLEPSSNWTLDYADDSCALRRDFGGEGSVVFMELRRYEPNGRSFQFIIASPHYELRRNRSSRDVTIRALPENGARTHDSVLNLEYPGDLEGITFGSSLFITPGGEAGEAAREQFRALPPPEILALEAQATGIQINHAFKDDLLLQTGSMEAPLQAMAGCLDELLSHWGIDVEAHRTLSRSATPRDMDVWVRPMMRTYPSSMIRNGERAVLQIRLDVAQDGSATGCHMQTRLGEDDFERTACDLLLRHAEFDPALDASGDPIDSYYVLRVLYNVS